MTTADRVIVIVWLIIAIYFAARRADPAWTVGAIVIANVWIARSRP